MLECGFQGAQAFKRGVGFDEFVARQDDVANGVAHRHDRAVKVALQLGMGGAALRLQREGIDVMAAEAFQRSNQVGANALGHEGSLQIGLRVLRPGAAIRANGHAAHALQPTGHHQVFPARAHFLRRHVHRFQARGAKAVDLHPCAAKVPARLECGHLGYYAALFAHGRHHAHHHVVHLRGIKLVALLQVGQQTCEQVDGLDFKQAAVFFALAARRSQGVKHIGFGHGCFSGGGVGAPKKANFCLRPRARGAAFAVYCF